MTVGPIHTYTHAYARARKREGVEEEEDRLAHGKVEVGGAQEISRNFRFSN